MTLNEALLILMKASERDCRGSGMGFRSTEDSWRREVAVAWTVAFKRVYKRDPGWNEYTNAGIRPPQSQ